MVLNDAGSMLVCCTTSFCLDLDDIFPVLGNEDEEE
jgi:hypothetical protein